MILSIVIWVECAQVQGIKMILHSVIYGAYVLKLAASNSHGAPVSLILGKPVCSTAMLGHGFLWRGKLSCAELWFGCVVSMLSGAWSLSFWLHLVDSWDTILRAPIAQKQQCSRWAFKNQPSCIKWFITVSLFIFRYAAMEAWLITYCNLPVAACLWRLLIQAIV